MTVCAYDMHTCRPQRGESRCAGAQVHLKEEDSLTGMYIGAYGNVWGHTGVCVCV